ncbi:hypothetical protein LEP1GSC013_0109 [Leptospira interrogans serovar Valbuzzi str. Duyster]|uniref:hypothetical protein n=1 Tax=Leptospira interrogans TaxID=173 RepID=UPI0002BE23CE|nr:hypothetical protein [Leptospira interrogans]EMJ55964.1 hypothetical protein LEP1GSC013_0109 [Leptospira interrogans serovar Valbuzzi str. Duyster]ENO70502.1 hypothetical protein LEP1GSC012_4280 [Leptospira interrogans serovar Valbuzzi str. Valbuzzi]
MAQIKNTIFKTTSKRTNHGFILIVGILILFLLDFSFFRVLIWKVPNESPWSSNHFYNFLYEYFSLQEKQKKNYRILIVGSSIAHYSFDREAFGKEILERIGKDVEVEFLSYAGMTPLDAWLCRQKIVELKPDFVIFPINFIDWRLHRAYSLNPEYKNETIDSKILLLDALDFFEAPQSRFIFPLETTIEFFAELGFAKTSEYISAFLFGFYRYKDIFWKNLRSLYDHRYGRNISYHGYNGVQIPERVTSLGWTGKNFSFILTEKMKTEGFLVQIVPEILASGPLKITFKKKNKVQSFSFIEPGWKKILLDNSFMVEDPSLLITAELSSSWIPFFAVGENKDWNYDRLGVRLQQTFGTEIPKNGMQYTREERLEDIRYLYMSDLEYSKYFNFRLLEDFDQRPGIGYLIALKDAKLRIREEKFVPVLHFQYLRKFSSFLKEKKVPLWIINNPENPISLDWYVKSNWYKDHLLFLKELSGDLVFFSDLKDSLSMQDFSDYHHFTFPGMMKMSPIYANEFVKISERQSKNLLKP